MEFTNNEIAELSKYGIKRFDRDVVLSSGYVWMTPQDAENSDILGYFYDDGDILFCKKYNNEDLVKVKERKRYFIVLINNSAKSKGNKKFDTFEELISYIGVAK